MQFLNHKSTRNDLLIDLSEFRLMPHQGLANLLNKQLLIVTELHNCDENKLHFQTLIAPRATLIYLGIGCK